MFCYGTKYAWFSTQGSHGLAAGQTRGPARISSWQAGDVLLLPLNCDQRQLHIHLQRMAERKAINMKPTIQGKKLFLYIFLFSQLNGLGQQVDILS